MPGSGRERIMIHGRCHCGAVGLAVPAAPDTVTRCNCSICRRLGALWAFYPVDALVVTAADGALDSYLWGPGSRRFLRCRHCGCTTHVLPVGGAAGRQAELNTLMFEPGALGTPRVRLFDGAVTWAYLDEGHPPTVV